MIRIATPFVSKFYQPMWIGEVVLEVDGLYTVEASCKLLSAYASTAGLRYVLRISHTAPDLDGCLRTLQRLCSRCVWLAHQDFMRAEFKAKALDWYKHPSPKLKRYWREMAEQVAASFKACS